MKAIKAMGNRNFGTFHESLLPQLEPMEAERIVTASKVRALIAGIALVGVLALLLAVGIIDYVDFPGSDALPEAYQGSAVHEPERLDIGPYFGRIVNSELRGWTGFVVILTTGLACLLLYLGFRHTFRPRFKAAVMAPLVRHFEPSLRYDPNGIIPKNQYVRSGLFPCTGTFGYEAGDHAVGMMGKTAIEFCELRTDDAGLLSRNIFNGLFFMAGFSRYFQGRTYVLPSGPASLLHASTLGNLERIRLESPEFEALFDVYTTDPVEAYALLSPGLTERILDFVEKSPPDRVLRMAFVDSEFYLALSRKGEIFEPHLFETLLDPGLIRPYYNDLSLAIGLAGDVENGI